MKEKLLIVDDAELNRAVLEELLSPEYEIVCAESGREALQILEQERDGFSLVLLDVMMPGMNGYEVQFQRDAEADACYHGNGS